MRSGCLRDLIVTARLDSVDQIWEQDGILDEENGDVVSNNVYLFRVSCVLRCAYRQSIRTEVSFICIESGCEAVYISCRIGTSAASSNSGKAREHRGLFALGGEEGGRC
jgi:hypothetical protein